ncbi:unnamed protein product [Mucor hiemalis]
MFGLIMLKTIAGKNNMLALMVLKLVKAHFIHTHNQAIRHWTMSTPSPGLFSMIKEQKVDTTENLMRRYEALCLS